MAWGVANWILLGLIVGFVATKLIDLRGDDPRMGIGLGAAGALLGGWLYSMISGSPVTPFNLMSLFFAAIACAIVLAAWHSWHWRSAA
jgi:uncharacterized membrane protein YeaQ/YmgE (transglycosylase-associated protein family)